MECLSWWYAPDNNKSIISPACRRYSYGDDAPQQRGSHGDDWLLDDLRLIGEDAGEKSERRALFRSHAALNGPAVA